MGNFIKHVHIYLSLGLKVGNSNELERETEKQRLFVLILLKLSHHTVQEEGFTGKGKLVACQLQAFSFLAVQN